MRYSKSHKECSQVKVSNLNNFCTIHCRALKFGTHEEESKLIQLTNSQQKVKNLFHTLLGVFLLFVSFCGFLTWWQNRHAYNPHQPLSGSGDFHLSFVGSTYGRIVIDVT